MGEHPPRCPKIPALLEANRPVFAHWDRVVEVFASGWGVRGRRRRLLEAALRLALDFHTWRRLATDEGLTDEEAAELFVGFAACVARNRDAPR